MTGTEEIAVILGRTIIQRATREWLAARDEGRRPIG
jgi:hypothetical protein